QAVVRVTGLDRGPPGPPAGPTRLAVEQQPPPHLPGLARVALVAMLDQQRPDLPLEQLRSARVGGGSPRRLARGPEEQEYQEDRPSARLRRGPRAGSPGNERS